MNNDDNFFIEKCLGALTPEEQEEFKHILETEHTDFDEMQADSVEELLGGPAQPMTLEQFEAALLVLAKDSNSNTVPQDKEWEYIENIVKQGILLKNKDQK